MGVIGTTQDLQATTEMDIREDGSTDSYSIGSIGTTQDLQATTEIDIREDGSTDSYSMGASEKTGFTSNYGDEYKSGQI